MIFKVLIFQTLIDGFDLFPQSQFSVQYNMDGIKGIDKLVLNFLQQPSCM